jgi:PAS domain S-box-containing protein
MGKTKVLLIDDERRIRQTFARTLKLIGYTVTTAEDGETGLAQFDAEQPDIVLLDLRMPGIDGLMVLQEMRKRDPEANVILATGHGDKDAVIETLRAGASDFLSKPVDHVSLESALRRAEERLDLKRKLRASEAALRQQNEQLEEMVKARTAELEGEIEERKSVQEELRQTLVQLEGIKRYTPDLITMMDRDGRYLMVNQAGAQFLGRASEEIVGKTFSDVLPPGEADLFMKRVERVFESEEPLEVEDRISLANGELVYATVLFPLFDQDGCCYAVGGIARDITERKQAEEALYESEAFLDTLLNAIPIPVFYKDREGRYLGFNSAFEAFFGETCEHLVGKSVFDISSPEFAEVYAARDTALFESGGTQQYESQVKDAQGVVHDVIFNKAVFTDSRGAVQGLIGGILDITDRKRAEAAVAEERARLSIILSSLNTGLSLINPDMTIAWVNQKIYDMFPGKDPLGRMCHAFYESRDTLCENCGTLAAFQTGETQVRERRNPSDRCWYRVISDPVKDEHGKVVNVLEGITDITERKRAEAALRESEEKLRHIVENSTNLFYSHTPEHVLTYLSPQTRTLLGCEPEEAMVRWTELVTDNPVNEVGFARTQKAIATGEPQPPYELELVDKRGRKIWVEVRESPVVEDGKTVAIVGSLTDITARKRANDALRKSEARARALLRAIPDMMFRLDRDGVYLDYKAVRPELYIQDEDIIIGKRNRDIAPPEFADFVGNYIARTLASGEMQVFEYQLSVPGRGLRDYEARMVPSGSDEVTAIVRDITERKQAEEEIEGERAFLSAVLDNIEESVVICDKEGRIVRFNEAARQLHGLPERPIPPDQWGEYYDLYQANGVTPLLTEEIPLFRALQGEHVRDADIVVNPEHSAPRSLVCSGQALTDATGEITGAVVTMHDITARKQLEAQIQEYAQHLEQLVEEKVRQLEHERAKTIQMDKMAAIGQMATGVAHELNQPLTAIAFDADYLKTIAHRLQTALSAHENLQELDELLKMGDDLLGDVQRCRRIVDHLRTFGHISTGTFAPISLEQPISDSLILTATRLREHGIDVQLHLAEDLPPILADPHKLEQVFLNLIANAEYALGKKGQEGDQPNVLEIATCLEGDHVVATVRDNGCGMPKEVQKHLFEPFYTTKPEGKGTGLGLSISYDIVTEFDGEITCESAVGEGTTFTLRFPVADPKEMAT